MAPRKPKAPRTKGIYTEVVPPIRTGKPHMLKPRIMQNFMTGLGTGNYIRTVCAWVGVNHVTYAAWLARGETEMERVTALGHDPEQIVLDAISEDLPEGVPLAELASKANAIKALEEIFLWCPAPFQTEEWKFVLFRVLVQRARAESEVRALLTIQTAAQGGQWQAAAWYLERSFPDQWGRKDQLRHAGPDGGPVQSEVSGNVTVDDLDAKIAAAIEEAEAIKKQKNGQ